MKKIKTTVIILMIVSIFCNTALATNTLQQNNGPDVAPENPHPNTGAVDPSLPDQAEEYSLPNIDWDSLSPGKLAAGRSEAAQDGPAFNIGMMTAASQASSFSKLPLSFQVADAAYDPVKPVVYLTDQANKMLWSVNYQTGESASLSFQYAPESLTFANGELYVSLLISGHKYNGSTEAGAVAIVDPDSLALENQFPVNIDPYDIEADTDYIYITSGSNQWTKIKSYSRATKQEVSYSTIRAWSYEKLHPTLNRIYAIDTDSSPRDFTAYNLSNGIFTDASYPGGYNSPYHGEYPMASNFRISPDGKYLFNGAGTIFNCDVRPTSDMLYKYTLDSRFSDIVFDLEDNVFYTAAANHLIAMYDYGTLQRIGQTPIDENVMSMNLSGDTLTAVCKTDMNTFYVETLAAPGGAMTPVPQKSVEGAAAFNGIITGIVYDAARGRAYAVDRALNKLYVVDPTGNLVERTVALPYSPDDLCISEDGQKLYIVNHDDSVMVTELDIASFTATRNLPFHCTDCINPGNPEAVRRHIYERGNRLYVVGGEWGPALYIFDAMSFNLINSGSISAVGDIGFTPDNSSFLYWRQNGWSAGDAGTDIYMYSIGQNTFTPAGQSGIGYPTLLRDPLDTPLLILPDTGIIICKKNVFKLNDLTKIVYTFPEAIYAVNAQETIAAGKHSIFHYDTNSDTWTSTPLISRGSVVKLFFAGDQLMALSRTDGGSGFYFLESIWTGETHSITGKIKLGYGVTAPSEGLKIQVKAASGNYIGTTNLSMQTGELSFTINNLPAVPDYALSYTISDSSSGKSADKYGFKAKGYYNCYFPVEDKGSATLLDLTAGDAAANITLIGNRTISGVISLPNSDSAPDGGLQLVMGVTNQYDGYLVPVIMPAGTHSAPYSLNVPSTAPYYGFNIVCYQADERYMFACGYSDSGTVPKKNLSNDVRVAEGNKQDIDITLIEARNISGTVSLPAGEVAKNGGLPVEVFAYNGNYREAVNVLIPAGENAVTYEINVPRWVESTVSLYMDAFGDIGNKNIHNYVFNSSALMYVSSGKPSSEYGVGYSLSADSGYQTGGYYGPGALTVSVNTAGVDVGISDQIAVDLTVLKGDRTISGRLTLPSGATAPAGGLNVYVVATNDKLDFSPTTLVHLSPGTSWGDYSLGVPALQGYYIYYYVDDNANPGYVPYGYYANTQTTINQVDAFTVDTSGAGRTGINLRITAGIAVSGSIHISPQPADVEMVVAFWNNDFEIDHFVRIAKSSSSQYIPYTIYVPAGSSFIAQYVINSQLDGFLKQGFYPGLYSSSAGYIGASGVVTVGTTPVTNIDFNLINADGMITGTIGMTDETGKKSYCIYMPISSTGYKVYYYLGSGATTEYENVGYYSALETTADPNAIGYAYLISGIASNIDLTLLPADNVHIKTLTSSSADVYLTNNVACTLYIAVYSMDGRMLSVGSLPVSANASDVHIDLADFALPEHYIVKVFFLDGVGLPQRTEYKRIC
jgi:hypothetical protein